MLCAAAALIAIQSIREIRTPHQAPAWYTLLVLGLVVAIKETLYRFAFKVGADLQSTAVKGDAWHHRSDALTSVAAFIGIAIALWGGAGYETADDWAALIACGVIAYNGIQLFRGTLDELMDSSVPEAVLGRVRQTAGTVEGVLSIEKCRIRTHGLHLAMDIHVVVDGNLTVAAGHRISHAVKDRLLRSDYRISDLIVHIEPGESGPLRKARNSA